MKKEEKTKKMEKQKSSLVKTLGTILITGLIGWNVGGYFAAKSGLEVTENQIVKVDAAKTIMETYEDADLFYKVTNFGKYFRASQELYHANN